MVRLSAYSRFRQRGLTREQLGYLLVFPALLLMVGTVLVPVVQTIWLSLQAMQMNRPDLPRGWNNFQNYTWLIQDDRFWNAVSVSARIVAANVAGTMILGMIAALILNESFVGRGLVRSAMLIPWAMPGVVIATLWRFMYSNQYGVINDILLRLGIIPSYQDILGGFWAFPAVLVAMIWRATPFTALLILAGLQMIPSELYEAAKIDGAGQVQRFLFITLPLVKSAALIALIFRSLDAFREFDILFNLTAGGPGITTENLALYAYKTYFSFLNFGYGATLAVAMALLSAIIVVFYIRLIGLQLTSRGS